MQTLTKRNPDGTTYFPQCFEEPCCGGGCTKDDCAFFQEACSRLADYEDGGKARGMEEKMKNPSNQLKPCPLCSGKAELVKRRASYFDPLPSILCESCGLTTRDFKTVEEAVCYWNRRGQKEEMTNYEQIAGTPERLAKWIQEQALTELGYCGGSCGDDECPHEHDCILRWLLSKRTPEGEQ